ncbi:hypothetical protein HL653_05820 [Sphingomonas sp. AP4-R1]|uniref:hypothetical protein n=1 Tax=Sphingomonas sp. AP4-R1 TaxID=2735134 RepID=UPI00149397C1|nr:hypothetical protein [Sphingomonas sp. AP4-R1]QJU57371.1 hypothetical protein HL653_05820 [Sphingomonas sp. AP4-R1]
MAMVVIVAHTLLAIVGGALAAATVAWLGWKVASWTLHPGWAPGLLFILLASLLHSSDFTQMFFLFGGLLSIVALVAQSTLTEDVAGTPARSKSVVALRRRHH